VFCVHIKNDGEQCQVKHMHGSEYCYWHDPSKALQRRQSASKGGKARHGRQIGQAGQDAIAPTPALVSQDITKLLWAEIAAVRSMERSLSRARTLAYLATALMKSYEVNDFAERLSTIEKQLVKAA
jgi:hypothetical protein